MKSRPAPPRRRPSSAIFLGNNGAGLPDLPSPPSPASSSASRNPFDKSQLPSPPHTNSTGSGSTGTGADTSSATGSVRVTTIMKREEDDRTRSRNSDDDGDDYGDHELGEDDTARLSDDRLKQTHDQKQNDVSTLQRVKSLTERNRQVLHKIASISSGSRLATPSPSHRAGNLPSTSATPFPAQRVSFAHARREVEFSGSETERDAPADDRRHSISSEGRSSTPPSSHRPSSSTYTRDEDIRPRTRLVSAPSPASSPQRVPLRSVNSAIPLSGRTRRLSLTAPREEDVLEEDESPGGLLRASNGKRRQPLPREFTADTRTSLDGRVPETRLRSPDPGVYVGRGSPSPTGSPSSFSITTPRSPRAGKPARAATYRDSGGSAAATYTSPLSPHGAQRRAARWSLSEDITHRPEEESHDPNVHDSGGASRRYRGENGPGRNLLQQGLRAAGLTGEEDVFGGRDRGNAPSISGSGSSGAISARTGTTRSAQSILSSRPSTSLSTYNRGEEDDTVASARARAHASLTRGARDSPSEIYRNASPLPGSRNDTLRLSSSQNLSMAPLSEHAKLMNDSLSMFESHLARFSASASSPTAAQRAVTPVGGGVGGLNVHELLRTATALVQSAQALNGLLRGGTSRALEAQIEAEVGEAEAQVDAVEVWRRVGGEYRECLRASDEVVRGVTGVLLGVGRVVREAGHSRGGSEDGSAGRSASRAARQSPDQALGHDLRRAASEMRPGSALSMVRVRERERENIARELEREQVAAAQERERERRRADADASERDRRRAEEEDSERQRPETAPIVRQRSSLTDGRRNTSPRPLSRSQRERDLVNRSPVADYPSPSPAPRQADDSINRTRTLPHIAIPPPLATIPSESLLRRKSLGKATPSIRQNRASTTSTSTVRAGTVGFPHTPTTVSATTALTPTTVSLMNSPEKSPIPLGSIVPTLSSASFFSSGRSRGASLTLSGLQERDAQRQRTISNTREDAAAATSAVAAAAPAASSSSRFAIADRFLRSTGGRRSLGEKPAGEAERPPAPVRRPTERRRTVTEMFSST